MLTDEGVAGPGGKEWYPVSRDCAVPDGDGEADSIRRQTDDGVGIETAAPDQ